MTTIRIHEKLNLESNYINQRDLVEDILENMGYVMLWETNSEDLPDSVQKALSAFENQNPDSYVDYRQ